MKKLILTQIGKEQTNLISKKFEIDPDFDYYDDMTDWERLVADSEMYVNEAYIINKFNSIDEFAEDISESEGIKNYEVIRKIQLGISKGLIKIVDA